MADMPAFLARVMFSPKKIKNGLLIRIKNKCMMIINIIMVIIATETVEKIIKA